MSRWARRFAIVVFIAALLFFLRVPILLNLSTERSLWFGAVEIGVEGLILLATVAVVVSLLNNTTADRLIRWLTLGVFLALFLVALMGFGSLYEWAYFRDGSQTFSGTHAVMTDGDATYFVIGLLSSGGSSIEPTNDLARTLVACQEIFDLAMIAIGLTLVIVYVTREPGEQSSDAHLLNTLLGTRAEDDERKTEKRKAHKPGTGQGVSG